MINDADIPKCTLSKLADEFEIADVRASGKPWQAIAIFLKGDDGHRAPTVCSDNEMIWIGHTVVTVDCCSVALVDRKSVV